MIYLEVENNHLKIKLFGQYNFFHKGTDCRASRLAFSFLSFFPIHIDYIEIYLTISHYICIPKHMEQY